VPLFDAGENSASVAHEFFPSGVAVQLLLAFSGYDEERSQVSGAIFIDTVPEHFRCAELPAAQPVELRSHLAYFITVLFSQGLSFFDPGLDSHETVFDLINNCWIHIVQSFALRLEADRFDRLVDLPQLRAIDAVSSRAGIGNGLCLVAAKLFQGSHGSFSIWSASAAPGAG